MREAGVIREWAETRERAIVAAEEQKASIDERRGRRCGDARLGELGKLQPAVCRVISPRFSQVITHDAALRPGL
jgi:hypothetical protein